MRFKEHVERVLNIAKLESVSSADATWIDETLANANAELSAQEQSTLAQFFWGTARAPIWLSLLKHHILNCPSAVVTEKGYQVPVWPAEPYLRLQVSNKEERAVSLLLQIDSNNTRFYEVAAEAALVLDHDGARAVLPILIEFARNRYSFTKRKLPTVLARFASENFIHEAMLLADEVVSFRPDPLQEEKVQRQRTKPGDWFTNLEPQPGLEQWEYQEALEKGVRPLALAAPFDTAQLLISAVSRMLSLKSHGDTSWHDTSEIWAPRLTERSRHDLDPKAALIRVLTYACEQVYSQVRNPLIIQSLDRILRREKWLVFTRVRYHLYAEHLDRTKSWVEEAIVEYPAYGESEYHFEFQQMIRLAAVHFGNNLLSQQTLSSIFDRILSGPDRERFKEFMGSEYTDEKFTLRQRYFHLAQLHPFAPILFGSYREIYQSLLADQRAPTDEDYAPFSAGESKTGGSRSPKSPQELAQMSDDELVQFLNEWHDVHRDPEQWWIDIDFQGIGIALKQTIQQNLQRFLNWNQRWYSIRRPIYLSYVLELAKERVTSGHLEELDTWLPLAEWVIQQPTNGTHEATGDGAFVASPKDWEWAQRAVVDLVEACLKKEVSVPIERRAQLFTLIRAACSGHDATLDSDQPVVTPRDFLTDAINTTRGRALQSLVQYGFWVRDSEGHDTQVPELFDVIASRFADGPPLTKPEYALLGSDFNRLYALDANAATRYSGSLFPIEFPDLWQVSFGTYISWNQAYKPLFGLLHAHFVFALRNLQFWQDKEKRHGDPIAHLGEHLFAHYVWGNDDLQRHDSLLRQFYEKSTEANWAELFDHVGRSLKNTPASIDAQIRERCKAFFEFRIAASNLRELLEFTFWLDAECLEAEWRLNAFHRTLHSTNGQTAHREIVVETLAKLLPEHPALVVQCFAQLTEPAATAEYFYLEADKVKPILKAGLDSSDSTTRAAAMEAQDNLLRAGHSEYLAVA
jgi:hypothetical protein